MNSFLFVLEYGKIEGFQCLLNVWPVHMMRLYFPSVGGRMIADFDSVDDCISESMKHFENKMMLFIALYKENLHTRRNVAFSLESRVIDGFPR